MNLEYRYIIADERELDELLSGRRLNDGALETNHPMSSPPPGSIGVVSVSRSNTNEPARPIALVAHEDDIRRLCGRYAQLHSDLSPLTAWCHLISPKSVDLMENMLRTPDLSGLIASWSGLIVAEARLLAGRPVASLRISACLATQSFSIARTKSLWNHVQIEDILRRFKIANELCRSENVTQQVDNRIVTLRSCLEPLWETLLRLSDVINLNRSDELDPVVTSLKALQQARLVKDKYEAQWLIRPLLPYVPEAEVLEKLAELEPEMRLKVFDKLVAALDDNQGKKLKFRHNALAMLAGYLATVAAGGSPSLSLAESHALRWPEITAWAYLVGGIGENTVWTSSFDGLGRLVARELLRPFRLDEPPLCDFAFDEANVLADPKLSEPLVHLRIKQARLVTVALLPGVNILIPIADTSVPSVGKKLEPSRPNRIGDPSPARNDPFAVLADALWPFLKYRIDEHISGTENYSKLKRDLDTPQRTQAKRKSGFQPELPLNTPKKY